MKRTEDGSVKDKGEQVDPIWNYNYLSRSVEFLRIGPESEDTNGSSVWDKSCHDAKLIIKLKKKVSNGQQNLKITVESTVADYFNVIICKNQKYCLPDIHLEMIIGQTHEVLYAPVEEHNGEPMKDVDISSWIQEESQMIQLWQQDSEEEMKKNIEFTDCIIRTFNGEQTYWANINVLAVQSPIIYNMIQDLQQQQYSHQNPLDLTELFRGFEDHEIHTFLCFVYNPYCTLVELKQIISLLQISIKLDNQGLIKRILATEKLGCIVRDQMYKYDDEGHPCNVDNVLNFAKQYNFHKLIVFCCMDIISLDYLDKQRCGEIGSFIDTYENL